MVAAAKAVVVDNKVLGVISLDISLNSLNKIIENQKMPYDGYALFGPKRDNACPPVKTR